MPNDEYLKKDEGRSTRGEGSPLARRSASVEQLANAVLYEGYILYPYRPSLKNSQRWTFGGVYPREYSEIHGGSDRWNIQTQCLIAGDPDTRLDVKIRFLHLMERTVGELPAPLSKWPGGAAPEFRPIPMLQVGHERFHSWQEAVEREFAIGEIALQELTAKPTRRQFACPARRDLEPLRGPGGEIIGVLDRRQEPLAGTVQVSAEQVRDGLFKLTARIENLASLSDPDQTSRDEALMHSLVSTHAILTAHGGEFVSLIDPPPQWHELAAECRNMGMWPVLVGDEGRNDTMLSAPIILYDYPQVAPESAGDLFDCTEIDEILTLRIMTLTEDEKRDVASIDDRTRALLARTETLARDQLLGFHGSVRGLQPFAGGE